jgi:hypothetical protein
MRMLSRRSSGERIGKGTHRFRRWAFASFCLTRKVFWDGYSPRMRIHETSPTRSLHTMSTGGPKLEMQKEKVDLVWRD